MAVRTEALYVSKKKQAPRVSIGPGRMAESERVEVREGGGQCLSCGEGHAPRRAMHGIREDSK